MSSPDHEQSLLSEYDWDVWAEYWKKDFRDRTLGVPTLAALVEEFQVKTPAGPPNRRLKTFVLASRGRPECTEAPDVPAYPTPSLPEKSGSPRRRRVVAAAAGLVTVAAAASAGWAVSSFRGHEPPALSAEVSAALASPEALQRMGVCGPELRAQVAVFRSQAASPRISNSEQSAYGTMASQTLAGAAIAESHHVACAPVNANYPYAFVFIPGATEAARVSPGDVTMFEAADYCSQRPEMLPQEQAAGDVMAQQLKLHCAVAAAGPSPSPVTFWPTH
jgi:hypothetical protein